jgi:NAD(P)-dependent dehydrogenase (short-subunit alcohol dehydrogenase family)
VKDLSQRVAVITGAGSGIGRGLAQAFAEHGAQLVLADVDASDLEKTHNELPTRTRASLVPTDVSRPEEVDALAEHAFRICGAVHVLCNNAGVGCSGLAWEQSLEDWEWLLGVNLMGVVHGIRSFVPRMLAQGAPAHVVNTSSMMGLLAAPGLGAYAASKHAVVAISESLRMDLLARGADVSVSVLCPGPVKTRVHEERGRPQASKAADAARPERVAQLTQLRELMARSMSPRAVADCVVEALREDRFYVLPAPEYVAGIEQRYREIHQQVDALLEKVSS